MTHDPLCPYFPEQQGFGGIGSSVPSTQPYIPGVPCDCDLIARVREDATREVYRDRLVFTQQQYDEEIAKVRADQHGKSGDCMCPHPNVECQHPTCPRWVPEVRAAALADAVEAVKDTRTWPAFLPPNAPQGLQYVVVKDDAVAAIAALGGANGA